MSTEFNFKSRRFFITTREFESRINIIALQFWTIQIFATFIKNIFDMLNKNGFVSGDLKVYSHLLDRNCSPEFSEKPKELFKNVCVNFPFEFLVMFDLFREHAC